MRVNTCSRRSAPIGSYGRVIVVFIIFFICCIGAADAVYCPGPAAPSADHSSSGHSTFSDGGSAYFYSGYIPSFGEWIRQITNPGNCVSGVKVKGGENGLDDGVGFAANKYSGSDREAMQQGIQDGSLRMFTDQYGDVYYLTSDGHLFKPSTGEWFDVQDATDQPAPAQQEDKPGYIVIGQQEDTLSPGAPIISNKMFQLTGYGFTEVVQINQPNTPPQSDTQPPANTYTWVDNLWNPSSEYLPDNQQVDQPENTPVTNNQELSTAEIQQLREYVGLFMAFSRGAMNQMPEGSQEEREAEIEKEVQNIINTNNPQEVRERIQELNTLFTQLRSDNAGAS